MSTDAKLREPLYDAGENAKIDFICVHGLKGDFIQTWEYGTATESTEKPCWPKDLLPQTVKESRVFSYQYPSEFSTFFPPDTTDHDAIDDISRHLMGSVGDYRCRTKTQNRPIIFIAHSLGGYVCANGLSSSWTPEVQSVKDHTVGAIFLGTPFQETDESSWEEMGKRFLDLYGLKTNENVQGLTRKSAKLQIICQRFSSFCSASADRKTRPFHVGYFSEGRKITKNNLGYIVPKYSAKLGDVEPITIDATHLNMCKYPNVQAKAFDDLTKMIKSMMAKTDGSITTREGIKLGDSNHGIYSPNYGIITGHQVATTEKGNSNKVSNTINNFSGNTSAEDDFQKRVLKKDSTQENG